ncbi:MAG TPA: helix-turn-helix transcriptional regulator [Caulobacteraceae bacterium]
MSWPLFFLALDIATIVTGAIFGARVLARRPKLASAQLIALIAFNSVCYVVLARYEYRYWIPPPYQFDIGDWAGVFNFARNLTPGLFMVLCFNLFSDKTSFPRWLLVTFAMEMLLEVIAYRHAPRSGALVPLALRAIPAILQTVFVAFALYWTVSNWSADLVEGRRRARIITTIIIGFNIVGSSLLLRVLIDQDSMANYVAHLALVGANLLITIFLLIFSTDHDLSLPLETPKVRRVAVPPASAEVADALARLNHRLDVEHIHRRPSLTLKDLADLVGLPEYRMRKLIHEQLGFQNFNAFLHDYRIRDACQQLRDPQMRRVPILTIALSTGYQSINTFNRGFREVMGMTPSAFRALDTTPPPTPPQKASLLSA